MSFDHNTALDIADETSMFELAPVSLWLEDASGVKALFERWEAAGMTSLRDWLSRPGYLGACLAELKILKVNHKTLQLFEAADFPQFIANLPKIVTTHSWECLTEQWIQLWEGQTTFFGKTVNSTASGRILDVQIRGNILPGHERSWGRVLVTIEDVTDLEAARRAAAANEAYARGLFEHSPVALWVKDFSGVKHLLDAVREAGIADLGEHFRAEPDFARRCLAAVEVIDVNRQALRLFAANDKRALLNIPHGRPPHDDSFDVKGEIVGLWNGKLFQQRDIVNRTLDGQDIHVQIQLSVLPGYEEDWAKVQIARIDITDRKKAEARLRHIGSHDLLTQLYNRSFFVERLGELEAAGLYPVTAIIIDLNGLKTVNDVTGHAAGDEMLRRMGKILLDLVKPPICAARIGGDEFALLMPNADEADGQAMVGALENLIARNNEVTPERALSISVGVATSSVGERLECVVSRADMAMYRCKAVFYATRSGVDAARNGGRPTLNHRAGRASARKVETPGYR